MKNKINTEHIYKWSPIIISIIALVFSYLSYNHSKKVSIQHIKPEVKVDFIYPKEKSPYVLFQNVSPIKCVSISVDFKIYIFDKTENCIIAGARQHVSNHGYLIFEDYLQPMQKIDCQVARIAKTNNRVIIYKFDIVYHRETDMKIYNDVSYYFIDDGTKIDHSDFRSNRYYKLIFSDIAYFEKHEFKAVDFSDDDAVTLLKQHRENNDIMRFEFHSRKGKALEKEGVLIMSVE